MINLSFEKYALPRLKSFVEAGMGPAEHYAIADEIIDAVNAISDIAEKSISALHEDAKQHPQRVNRIGRPLDKFEILQTVVATINRLSPDFATSIEQAADEDRYVLEPMGKIRGSIIPVIEQIPTPSGKFGLFCETDGTISSLHAAMIMAGQIIAVERSEMESAPVDTINRMHHLSLTIQGHFFAQLLFDTAKKPLLASYSDADANLEKRTSAAYHMDIWMSAMNVYRSGMRYAELLPPGDQELPGVLESTGVIHETLNAPALCIASALYDGFSAKTPSEQKVMLNELYPAPGKYPQNHNLPPVETLLAIAGARDNKSLKQVFDNAAISLFPISAIEPVRQTFGLYVPTAQEIQKYNR